jgi:hypothetical protein
MKKASVLIFTLFLLISPTVAKDKKITFDAQAAWSYLKNLASDSMQGRRSGQPGGTLAEEFIASKFKEWGLEPAGDENTYFQNFTIEHRNIEEGVVLEIITERERRDFHYSEDWNVQRYSGSGHFVSEIVFVGYGIHAPDKGYDDYASVDVKGKIILLASGEPQKLAKKVGDAAQMTNRIEAAQKLGARGAIVFRPSTSQSQSGRIDKKIYRPDFVFLRDRSSNVTNFIFKDLDTETHVLLRDIETTSKPQSLETGVKAFISVNAIFDEKRPTRNVIAKITGTDEVLKGESVMIGGHMDHLGITPMGDVMNGANDNASGTAVTMEVARVMKMNGARPKRTVIFALWAGEEQGLLGSVHYADHPCFPIEKTVSYINMDMVGHGSDKITFHGVYYAPNIWKLLKERLPKDILDYVEPNRGGPGGSDHTPFLEKGVPGFFIFTGGIKYHQSRDDSDLIKPELLKKTGDLVHAAVEILASEPGNFIMPTRQETYYLKYQNLINYKLSPLSNVIANHGDIKDPLVDLQLSVIPEEEGLSGDELRIDVLKKFLVSLDEVKKAKGLSYFSSSGGLSMTIRQGQTTTIAGINGLSILRDYPRWAQVLAKQGLYFVVVDDPSFLFGEQGLSEEGKKIIEAVTSSSLLLFVKGINDDQDKALLETSKKPIVLLKSELASKEVMDLIKEKESAIGLILGSEEDPIAYFKKMDEIKKSIGTEYLMMVNQDCLWESRGKKQMIQVISEIIKANYDRSDVSNVFSSTFLRVLDKARSEGAH